MKYNRKVIIFPILGILFLAFILLLLYKIVSPEQKKTIDFVSEYGNFNSKR